MLDLDEFRALRDQGHAPGHREYAKYALGVLGVALADHDHQWTDEERRAFDDAESLLSVEPSGDSAAVTFTDLVWSDAEDGEVPPKSVYQTHKVPPKNATSAVLNERLVAGLREIAAGLLAEGGAEAHRVYRAKARRLLEGCEA